MNYGTKKNRLFLRERFMLQLLGNIFPLPNQLTVYGNTRADCAHHTK
jgi:hypothetical protein